MTTEARIIDAQAAKAYILAGKAIVTLRSVRTGVRFTFRVTRAKGDGPYFVSVLTGPDNTTSYSYHGTLFDVEGDVVVTSKSRVTAEAPSAKAFAWSWRKLREGQFPAELEVFHSGRCGRCGRLLTDPDSVTVGLGPICRGR